MSTSRSPVGPLPAKVYWRRRIVVGLGLLAVLVAIVLIVVRPGQGAATPPSDPPASSPAAESAEPDEAEEFDEDAVEQPADADGTPGACSPGAVELEAVLDKENYAQDELPQLSLTLTNIGSSPCVLQAGTDVQEYRITSGSDLIWSSKHCQQGQQPVETLLEPGKPVSTTPFGWSRERSDPNTCEDERAAAIGGGATYVLQVLVGDLQSDANRFVLL